MSGQKFSQPEQVEQRDKALRRWMSGATYQQIADHINVSYGTAYQRVQQAIDAMRPHADYDQYRAVQLAELEMARKPLRRIIVESTNITDLAATITTLLKVQEREAKLLGLDRVTTPIDEITSMTDEQLAAIAAEWAQQIETEDAARNG